MISSVELPGPQPRSTAWRSSVNGTCASRSRAGRVRSSSNFTYWLADHAIVFLLISGHVLDAADANFVDVAAIELDHLEGQIAGGEGLAFMRQMPETPEDEASQCRIAVGIVNEVVIEQLGSVADVDPAI